MYLSQFIRSKIVFFSGHRNRPLLFLFSLIILSGCASISESDQAGLKSERIYTPSQLRADLQFLDNALRNIHPEPFARLNRDIYNAHYQQLYQNLSWPSHRHDFYLHITPLVAEFSDIHTRVLYPHQEYQQFLAQHGKFPLTVLYTSDGLIVVADQQQPSEIPVGAELLAINNKSIESIIDNFRRYIPAETESGQIRMIQMEFARLLWSIYQIKTDYQVDYLWQGKKFRTTVKGQKQQPSLQQESVASHYGSIAVDDKTTMLWFNDFNQQYQEFDNFLQHEFQNIKDQNKDTLILDLRYNQGGIIDNLALLLTYLTAQPVNWANHITLKLSEPFRQQHSLLMATAKGNKYGNYLEWMPVEYLNLWQWKILFGTDGDFLESDIAPVISDKNNIFTGNLFILSNGYCYSACASLIAILEQNNLATIIGEPAGSLTHIQYGYPVEVVLPNTGLKLVVPAMKFVLDLNDKQIPNILPLVHQIQQGKNDVLVGRDSVFDYTIELSKPH